MNSRERVLSAFERRGYDRIPVKHEGTPEINKLLMDHFGLVNLEQVLLMVGDDFRYVEPPYIGPELRKFPDGSVEVATPATPSQEAVFDESDHRVWRWAFAPRAVRPGCVIEYRYRIEQLRSVFHSWLPLQFDVPTREVAYELTPLTGLRFYYAAFNCSPKVKQNAKNNRYSISLHDVAAYRGEADMPPEKTARAGTIVFYGGSRDRVEPADYWPQVSRDAAASFEATTKPDGPARQRAAGLLAGAGDPVDRLSRLVVWCRTRIRLVPDDADSLKAAGVDASADGAEALRVSAATAVGCNRALATLCRAAGFDVRLLLTASHAEFHFDQGMLNPGLLPGCETAVRFRGSWLPLSAVERYADWDMLPRDEEGDVGLLCDRDSTCFILTPSATAEGSSVTRTADLTLQPNGALEGELQLRFSGHCNSSLRDELEPGDLTLQQLLEHRRLWTASECEVSGLEAENLAQPWEPLRVRAHVRIHDHVVPGSKRLLIEPAVLRAHAPPRFAGSERRQLIAFEFAQTETDTIRIHVGEAWRLAPADAIRPLDGGDLGRYVANVASDTAGTSVTYARTLLIAPTGTLTFPVSAYADVRRFFDAVHDRDRITLTFSPAGKP